MRELLRRYPRTFFYGTLAGLALRLLFALKFPVLEGDGQVYAQYAGNWLHHGILGPLDNGVPVPSCIRLPGYPAFLAAIFALFRSDNLHNVLRVQVFIDMATCYVVARGAFKLFSASAARWAFWIAALCPFTANYVAMPLTETLSICFSAVALFAAARLARELTSASNTPVSFKDDGQVRNASVEAGISIAGAVLLRPDGGLLLISSTLVMAWLLLKARKNSASISRMRKIVVAGMVVGAIALAPLVPWTVRNWRDVHVFQPLAPRYANAPDEYVPTGVNRWVKTWLIDYQSVEDVYWKISTEPDAEPVDVSALPMHAFNSAEEYARVAKLLDDYDSAKRLTPELDARFEAIARERIRAHRFAYYFSLPLTRMLDMWFRPRTEMLPIDHYWAPEDPIERTISWSFIALNALLVTSGIWGMARAPKDAAWKMLVAYVVLRSLFLTSLENPEPRYVLECFPVMIAFAGVAIAGAKGRQ